MSMEMTQKSGNNSQLVQAQTINYYGITEERARQIIQEEAQKILNYTQEACATANERINKLENAFMQAALKYTDVFKAFSDPYFQLLLRDASTKATATEREEDYDLLSQLLICHVKKGSERKNKAAIRHAILIVDEIDNDALCALTNAHAVECIQPVTGNCREGLKVLDDLFSKLMYMNLPSGNQWLEHLEMLGAIKTLNFRPSQLLVQHYSGVLDGYVCVGIKKDSPQFETAQVILSSCHPELKELLIENECLEGYVRLELVNRKRIDDSTLNYLITKYKSASRFPTQEDIKDAIKKVFALYSDDSKLMGQARQNFEKIFDEYEHLSKLKKWSDAFPQSFSITPIGKVLAYTNAKRCDSNLPDLKL
ncbi:MAG: hypothetical protein IJU47_07260 [Verrucomicrobia bacterium]|nr:hypothetical protein [Verrucomicrobiota bacterium]